MDRAKADKETNDLEIMMGKWEPLSARPNFIFAPQLAARLRKILTVDHNSQ